MAQYDYPHDHTTCPSCCALREENARLKSQHSKMADRLSLAVSNFMKERCIAMQFERERDEARAEVARHKRNAEHMATREAHWVAQVARLEERNLHNVTAYSQELTQRTTEPQRAEAKLARCVEALELGLEQSRGWSDVGVHNARNAIRAALAAAKGE